MSREKTKLATLIEKFVEKSQSYYPGLSFGRRFSLYGGDEPLNCSFEYRFQHGILKETPYHVEPKTYLIHYGSFPTSID